MISYPELLKNEKIRGLDYFGIVVYFYDYAGLSCPSTATSRKEGKQHIFLNLNYYTNNMTITRVGHESWNRC